MIFPLAAQLDALAEKGLKSAAETVSRKYRESTDKAICDETQALAYAASRMPATFGAVGKALQKTLETYRAEIGSVLDVGAGTGAATLAARQLLDAPACACLEKQDVMRALGQKLVPATWEKYDLETQELPHRADLVVAAYVLNELKKPVAAALKLWRATDGVLLIVDAAAPQTSAMMQTVRAALIQEGGHIAAPCPAARPCAEWCHFAARVERSRLHRHLKGGDAPYEDEKFTFLAFSKTPVSPVEARVLRHPQISSGKVGLTLCTAAGTAARLVTKKEKEVYKAARKADAGDAFAD